MTEERALLRDQKVELVRWQEAVGVERGLQLRET